jgi:hypothetical protein
MHPTPRVGEGANMSEAEDPFTEDEVDHAVVGGGRLRRYLRSAMAGLPPPRGRQAPPRRGGRGADSRQLLGGPVIRALAGFRVCPRAARLSVRRSRRSSAGGASRP